MPDSRPDPVAYDLLSGGLALLARCPEDLRVALEVLAPAGSDGGTLLRAAEPAPRLV